MGYKNFMSKVRHWDNKSANWIMRHFYLLFFEAFLVLIFLFFFANTLKVIDLISIVSQRNNITESLLLTQSINTLLIVLLLLLNSFWMLYMFNSILRLRTVLKDIHYVLIRGAKDRK